MLDMESIPRVHNWGGRDQLRDLQQQIDQMHFSYLETDDSPQKIEQRQKLEGFIKEYLCLVPHSRKFVLRETLQVLHKSAALPNFSGYRAALAWNAVARYAANLLTQPWRKEYKEIKLYCGFYKHEIAENLAGAEIMFEAMGYKRIDESTLLLDGPICPDQVAHVSRDSLVAVVECQLLKNVWESVSAVCNVKWLEALQFREMHIGGPEQASKALLYRHNENNYHQRKPENNSNSYPPLNDMPYQQYIPVCNRNVIAPDMTGQCLYGQFISQNPYAINCYNQPAYTITIPVNMPNPVGVPYQQVMPNYMMPNYINAPKHYARYNYNQESIIQNNYSGPAHVATGQLIEVDAVQNVGPQPRPTYNNYADEVDSKLSKYNYINQNTNGIPTEKTNNNKEHYLKDGLKSDESFETWDYVYRDLEKQGYSKDLGDRENILENKVQSSINTNMAQLENSFKNMSVQKSSKDYETYSRNDIGKSSNNSRNTISKVNSSKPKNDTVVKHPQKKSNQSSENIERGKSQLRKSDYWQCVTCTFNNTKQNDICEMCGKSKNAGSEIQPLTSGGKECAKCTLVNEKDVKICIACGASLLDSPTYI